MLRIFSLMFAVVGCLFITAASADEPRPDILLIMADDLGYGDIGCFNDDSKIKTPSFDRAATEGIRLTDSHSPASWCTPTRYSLMTGNYPFRSKIKRDKAPVISDNELTLPRFLQKVGYSTAMVGKWHLGFEGDTPNGDHFGGPVDRGFDSYFGIPRSLDIPPYYWIEDRTPIAAPTEMVEANNSDGWSKIQGAFWRKGLAAPNFKFDGVTPTMKDRAVELISSQGEQGDRKPYFLYVPLPSPHTPWVPSRDYAGTCELALYGDFVAQVDGVVDELLAAVESIGATENTLIIITSDNGACWYGEDDVRTGHDASGGYRGMKGDAHEGGHRMPTIVRWPKRIPAGTSSAALTCHADMFATVAGFLRKELPANAANDSFDMSSTWEHAASSGSRADFVEEATGGFLSIREGAWKLIPTLGSAGFTQPKFVKPTPDGPAGQLYNLADDPFETNNLYSEHPEKVTALTTLLDERRKSDRTRP